MKRAIFILLGAVIVMTAIHPLPAQERKSMVRRGVNPELTEAQQKQIKANKLELAESITPLKSEIKVLDAELQKLMISDGASQRDIDRKIDEISTLRTQMQKLRVKNQRLIRSLLTDEQRVQFDKCIVNDPRMKGRGMRGGRDGMRMQGRRSRMPFHRGRAAEINEEIIEKEEI